MQDLGALARVGSLPTIGENEVEDSPSREVGRLVGNSLDVEQAVKVALLNNRDLRARLRTLGISRGALIQAGILPNPTIEAELLPERNTTLELRVEYDLTRLLLVPLRAGAAKADLESARYDVAGDALVLGYRVRAAFYAAQASEQRLRIGMQALDALAAARDAAEALRLAGNTTALDVVGQESALERARVHIASLELVAVKAREAVTRLLGLHGSQVEWKVSKTLPPPPEALSWGEHLETECLSASLELSASKYKLEALARQGGATRTEGLVPDVVADVHALGGDPTTDQTSGVRSWRFGGGVRVGLPIFDRKQGRVIALESAFDAELERYYGKAIDIRSAARELRAAVTSSHARARHYQAVILPVQARVTAESLLQYNAMQIGIFALLSAKREELDVELAYVETLREFWTARAALDALIAGQRVEVPGMNMGGSVGTSKAGEH